jgi:hypothetical protein
MKEILCARENCELWKSPQHIFCMLQELVTNIVDAEILLSISRDEITRLQHPCD